MPVMLLFWSISDFRTQFTGIGSQDHDANLNKLSLKVNYFLTDQFDIVEGADLAAAVACWLFEQNW